jgi:hypothetical protein
MSDERYLRLVRELREEREAYARLYSPGPRVQ